MKMKKTFVWIGMLVFLASLACAEKAFIVKMSYVEGALMFDSVSMGNREIQRFPPGTLFLAELVDFSNSTIYRMPFEPSQYGPFTLNMPYNESASEIRIRDLQNVFLNIKVSHFAQYCGNKVCKGNETKENCPQDCVNEGQIPVPEEKKEEAIEKNETTENDIPAKEEKKEEPKDEKPAVVKKTEKKTTSEGFNVLNFVIIVFGVLISVMIIFVLVMKSKTESAQKDNLRNYVTQCMRQGYPAMQIREFLIRQGNDQKTVDEIIKEIYRIQF